MEHDKYEGARRNAQGWYESIVEMLAALDAAENNDDVGPNEKCQLIDAARQTIDESVLSVRVRDGWRQPGRVADDKQDGPEEFEILLTTGGPALRIWGRLNQHNEPAEDCELQMQDWFVPWTAWAPEPYDENFRDNIRRFASCFWFGE